MELNDLFQAHRIDPDAVLVMRHVPQEPKLRKVLPWLAAERHEVFNAYQQTQNPKAEAAMKKASYVASFIGQKAKKALFIGLYRRGAWRSLNHDEYWRIEANKDLGALGHRGHEQGEPDVLFFELELTDFYANWKGRLVVDWPPPELSWWRWSGNNQIAVSAIHENSILSEEKPEWEKMILTWQELKVLPQTWRAALAEWRGIYLIFDESDSKGYVGSAYGNENILGRWLNYSKLGHGGNKELIDRDPNRFRFSILQRVSPDMEPAEVIRIESSWKRRLHTREFGMNKN